MAARASQLCQNPVKVVMPVLAICVSLIDWISDTLSQGYTNLQSLVKCLDHRGIASDTVCSQARLCEAAQCIEMHLGGYIYSHGQ